jgi:hypothetical protein
LIEVVEATLHDTRKHIEVKFASIVGKTEARRIVCEYETQLVRMLFKKGAHSQFHPGCTGNLDEAKIDIVKNAWLAHVERQHERLRGISAQIGIELPNPHAEDAVLAEVA